MALGRLSWGDVGVKEYQTGVEQGVLYLRNTDGSYPTGVAWNGLTGVTESPSGAEVTKKYADNQQYGGLESVEEFAATVEAFMSPPEFDVCDGSAELVPGVLIGQQKRKQFGMAYKTKLGNDVDNDDYGYILHLVYGAKAKPSEKAYQTMNESPDMMSLSWELSTTPVPVAGFKPTASMTINSTKVSAAALKAIEDILYGLDAVPAGEGGTPPEVPATDARLPLPNEIKAILTAAG